LDVSLRSAQQTSSQWRK